MHIIYKRLATSEALMINDEPTVQLQLLTYSNYVADFHAYAKYLLHWTRLC